MDSQRIMLLTNRAAIASYIFDEARIRGHEMVVFMTASPSQQPSLNPRDPYAPDVDVEALSSLCRRWGVSTGIYASTASRTEALQAAARLRQVLARDGIKMVAHPPEVLDVTLDKWRSRCFLRERGIAVPRSAYAEGPSDVERAVAVVGGCPAVIKLLNRSGGVGVHIVRDEGELARLAAGGGRELLEEPYLVEEFLEGTEYSVEVLVGGGRAVPHAVVNKGRTGPDSRHPMERARLAPWEGPEADAVRSVAVAAARVIGGEGVLEFDIVVSSSVPSVLEVNPRLGGITFMGLAVGGATTLGGLLEMALGTWEPAEAKAPDAGVVAELPLTTELSIGVMRRLKQHPAVRVVAPRRLQHSSGNVTLAAASPELLGRALEELVSLGIEFVGDADLRLLLKEMRTAGRP